jgi:2-keto-4-pentenoate hydratase
MNRGAAALLLALAAAAPARAACPDIPTVARFASALLDRRVPAPFAITSMAEARCAQDRLVALLAQPWGDVPGPALAAESLPPLRGALFHASLRAASGATIAARFGARPAVAPGIVLRLGEDGRPASMRPYLALLDLAAMPGGMDAVSRTAGNLGLRLGVVGAEASPPVDVPEAVLMIDGGVSAALPRLGLAAPPEELLATLRQARAAEGRPLRPGEQVALLAAAAPLPPRPGETWRLSIMGLGAVTVNFR